MQRNKFFLATTSILFTSLRNGNSSLEKFYWNCALDIHKRKENDKHFAYKQTKDNMCEYLCTVKFVSV